MKLLLVAAGKGTRLGDLSKTTPKCLVQIGGRPLLSYWFNHFLRLPDKSKLIINTHHLANLVTDYIADQKIVSRERINVEYEKVLLGTAGTLISVARTHGIDDYMFAHADNFSIFNINEFLNSHRKRPVGTEITMMTFMSDLPSSCGIVETNRNGVVTRYDEKPSNPKGNIANGAVYLISKKMIKKIISDYPDATEFSVDVLPFIKDQVYTYFNGIYHRDIGNIESLVKCNRDYAELKDLFFGL